MAIMIWNDSFLVGVKEFDDHHKQLVDLINRIYDEYSDDPATGDVAGKINELTAYAGFHFEAEERWMKETGYPKISQQIDEHTRFSERIAAFKAEFLSGQTTTAALFFFLSDWLTTHILESDADYGRFYAEKGESQES